MENKKNAKKYLSTIIAFSFFLFLLSLDCGANVVSQDSDNIDDSQPRWSFSFHGGATFAMNDLGSRYKSRYMFAVDAGYYLNPRVSVLALIGYNQFKPKYAFSYLGNTDWWNLSANIKWEFTTKPTRPYVNGGVGLYIPKTGLTKPGFNVGAGLDRSLIPNLVLEFGVNYHHILTELEDPEFYTVHAGLIYRL